MRDLARGTDGDRMARHIATGLASVLVAAALAGGARLWTLGEHCTESRARLDAAESSLRELHERVGRYPAPSDVIGNRERIAVVERDLRGHTETATDWRGRIERLEAQVHEITTRATARPDPFTGTMGRALESRIERLEQKKR